MKRIATKLSLIFIIAGTASIVLASSGGDDLIKMARSGVDEEVLQSYIESSSDTFDLNAEDIITLKDLGVSSKVISEALRHGNEIDSAAAHKTIKEAMGDPGEPSPVLSTAAAVAPPADNLNISFFYESLYPYGNWVMIDGEWCWQPNATVINEEWAPYCDRGHWIYSDWGWCWMSDYSWGWAPFHYGRWFHHQRNGWCWIPDTDWGPAWVAWRSGNGYCGWAPLPPHSRYVPNSGFYFGATRVGNDFEFNLTLHDYHFLPIGSLDDPHPWRHIVAQRRAEEALGKTSFVRDGYSFDHGHIFNRGFPIDEVSKTTGRNIHSMTVAAETIRPGQPIHRGMVRENRLFVYKPAISPAAPETPPVIQSRFVKGPSGVQSGNSKRQKGFETPVPLPRSRIVPQPSSDDRERIKRQFQFQVRDEARMERQRDQSLEERPGRKDLIENQPRQVTPAIQRGNGASKGGEKKPERKR
jgi:hypothetical protein